MRDWVRHLRGIALVLAVGALATVGIVTSSASGGSSLPGASGGAEATTQAGALIVNAPVGPATLDMLANACGANDFWGANFYVRLARNASKRGPIPGTTMINPNKIGPYLASSWKVSKDGRSYTIRLNPRARFNDGSPIDANAIKFSVARAKRMNGCGAYTWSAGLPANGVPQVKVLGRRTVVLRYKEPSETIVPSWANLSLAVYSPKATNSRPDTAGSPVNRYWANHIAGGGGPFILQDYQPNRRMVLRRNPRFFGPRPGSNRITVNFIQSESTRILQARSGRADVTLGLSPDAVAGLRNARNLKVAVIPTFYVQNINLNWDIPPLNNVKFREALTYAVPYGDILRNIVRGYGSLYYGPITKNTAYFNRRLSSPRQFDLDRARRLIGESGVRTPLSLELVVLQGDAVPERIATVLQSIWRGIGISLNVRRLGPTEYNEVVFGKKAQMSIRTDGPGAPVPSWHLLYDMLCGSAFNASQICIRQADTLLQRARKSRNEKVRQRLYNSLTRLWRAQSPKIILYGINEPVVLNDRVKSYNWYGLCCGELRSWRK